MRDISADFDPDTEAIRADEVTATARKAVAAAMYGLRPPLDTPLQRDAARIAETAWRRQQIADMRARAQH